MSAVTTSSPVARWLDAILCNSRVTKKYTDILKQLGCESLNEVYRLDSTVLIKMGIAPIDCERIMENVLILRQTQYQLQGVNNSMYLGYSAANETQIITPTLASNAKPARKPKATKSDKQKDSMATGQMNPASMQPVAAPTTGRKGKAAGRKANNSVTDSVNNNMMPAPAPSFINGQDEAIDIHQNQQQQIMNRPPPGGAYSSMSYNNNNINGSEMTKRVGGYGTYPAPGFNTSNGQPQPHYSSNYSNSNNNKIGPTVNQAYYQGGQYQVPTQQLHQQQQQPQSQQSNYYQNGQATSNQNWTNNSDEIYTHQQYNPSQHQHQQQQHSGNNTSSVTNANSKNSPLEYLERLALMPEAVDQKNIMSNENTTSGAGDNSNDDPFSSRTKRKESNVGASSGNNDSFMMSSTPPKKQCSSSSSGSNSNSPINSSKSMPSYNNCSMFINNGGDFVNPRYTNSLNDSSPASTCSNTSSVSSASQLSHGGGGSNLNVTMNALNASSSSSSSSSSSNSNNESAGLVSANLIDACNFDFFDLLPELNSSAIDQAINPGMLNDQSSAQSSASSSSASSNATNNNANNNNNNNSSTANEFNLSADQYFNGEPNLNFNAYNPF